MALFLFHGGVCLDWFSLRLVMNEDILCVLLGYFVSQKFGGCSFCLLIDVVLDLNLALIKQLKVVILNI